MRSFHLYHRDFVTEKTHCFEVSLNASGSKDVDIQILSPKSPPKVIPVFHRIKNGNGYTNCRDLLKTPPARKGGGPLK